jgi:hypothetical protein
VRSRCDSRSAFWSWAWPSTSCGRSRVCGSGRRRAPPTTRSTARSRSSRPRCSGGVWRARAATAAPGRRWPASRRCGPSATWPGRCRSTGRPVCRSPTGPTPSTSRPTGARTPGWCCCCAPARVGSGRRCGSTAWSAASRWERCAPRCSSSPCSAPPRARARRRPSRWPTRCSTSRCCASSASRSASATGARGRSGSRWGSRWRSARWATRPTAGSRRSATTPRCPGSTGCGRPRSRCWPPRHGCPRAVARRAWSTARSRSPCPLPPCRSACSSGRSSRTSAGSPSWPPPRRWWPSACARG